MNVLLDRPQEERAKSTATSPARAVVSHSGKQHAYRVAAAVQGAGRLSAFITSGYYKPTRFPDRLAGLSTRIDRTLRLRHSSEIDDRLVHRNWKFELPELVARRVGLFGSRDERWVFWRDMAFDRATSRLLDRGAFDGNVFWGFQGSCRDSLKSASRRGLSTVAEFAAPHVTMATRLLREEALLHPEWADSLGNYHFPDEYRARLEDEPHLADHCVVASRFAEASLLEVGVKPTAIRRIPLGVDLSAYTASSRPSDGPFRVLFAGKIGQHKGVRYLLEAFRRIRTDSMELVFAGPLVGPGKAFLAQRDLFRWRGPLRTDELADEMRRCHVLVLPSVIEGFGLVIAEAMATGMPVIASSHSIGPEIVREGISGFVVPPRDVDALAARLADLAGDRNRTCAMGEAAAHDARAYSWQNHARRVGEFLMELDQSVGAGSE